MYFPIILSTENQLNKILKQQKKLKLQMGVMFVSLWDKHSQKLVKRIKSTLTRKEGVPLYIVDSYTMPHAFVIFKTTKVPHLVQFKKGGALSEDYLPNIYEELGL
mgnify:CR=1 FL=1